MLTSAEPSRGRRPYAEAVSRLASIRHALRLVEPFGAGPASDLADDEADRRRLGPSGEAKQRQFDRRSARWSARPPRASKRC